MQPATTAVTLQWIPLGAGGHVVALLGGLDAESRYRRWFAGGVDIRGAEEWAAHPERVTGVGLLAFIGDRPVGDAVLVPAGSRRMTS